MGSRAATLMPMLAPWLALALAGSLAGSLCGTLLGGAQAAGTAPGTEHGCAPGRVEFRAGGAADGRTIAGFNVEIADDEAERAQGLMFRRDLAASAGMLFVYPAPGHPYFWMKNTRIPLDMIFLDPAGRVQRVQAMAVPGDETPIDGGAGAQYVLEIGGGLAGRLGIAAGAQMRSAVLDPAIAAWPCDPP